MPQMTNAVQVATARWTDLGAGPLTVSTRGAEWADVVLALADGEPPATSVEGEPLRGSRAFVGTAHVWALARGQPVGVVVTAPEGAAGAGYAPSNRQPLAGTLTTLGQSTAFAPLAGRGFNVSLWNAFSATVQLERSFDGGTTWLPLTAAGTQIYRWVGPASESAQDDEAGVLYRFNCIAYASGTIAYRMSQ